MFLPNAGQYVTHGGFTNQKLAGPFPSLPNRFSLFASFPFSFRRLPGKANQSEAARVHGSDCAGLRRA